MPTTSAAAPAHRQRDQHDDGQRRDQQVLDQLVRLLLRGLAVVARHLDVDVGRQQPRPQVARPWRAPRSASAVALAPVRLATRDRDRLRARSRPARRPRRRRARARRGRRPGASSGPSTTRATFETYTGGRPCATPTTTRPTSSELRKSGPTSTRSSRLSRTAVPAPWRSEAACSAPVSCVQLTPAAAMRSGSGSTRTTRGWPPISCTRLVSGTSESSCASSAASGRSRSLVQPLAPQRQASGTGTSSIECSSTIGGSVPCGMIQPIALCRS